MNMKYIILVIKCENNIVIGYMPYTNSVDIGNEAVLENGNRGIIIMVDKYVEDTEVIKYEKTLDMHLFKVETIYRKIKIEWNDNE